MLIVPIVTAQKAFDEQLIQSTSLRQYIIKNLEQVIQATTRRNYPVAD